MRLKVWVPLMVTLLVLGSWSSSGQSLASQSAGYGGGCVTMDCEDHGAVVATKVVGDTKILLYDDLYWEIRTLDGYPIYLTDLEAWGEESPFWHYTAVGLVAAVGGFATGPFGYIAGVVGGVGFAAGTDSVLWTPPSYSVTFEVWAV